VQKERNDKIIFSEIIKDLRLKFLSKWRIFSIFSRKLSDKSFRGHTDFFSEILSPTCVETLCKISKLLKIWYWRWRYR
jgi:hypothetical protein